MCVPWRTHTRSPGWCLEAYELREELRFCQRAGPTCRVGWDNSAVYPASAHFQRRVIGPFLALASFSAYLLRTAPAEVPGICGLGSSQVQHPPLEDPMWWVRATGQQEDETQQGWKEGAPPPRTCFKTPGKTTHVLSNRRNFAFSFIYLRMNFSLKRPLCRLRRSTKGISNFQQECYTFVFITICV